MTLRIFACMVTISSALFLTGCGAEATPEEAVIRPVRAITVSASNAQQTRTFAGTARAGTEINMSFRVAGTLRSVAVKVGMRLKKGTVIATLDDADQKLQVDQAKAQEENARIGVQTAKANLDRVRGLYENNNIALSEYESAKNNYAAAVSNYETSKKATNLNRSQLSYTKLFAPMDGFIGAVNAEVNENVQAGSVIAVLNSENDLEIVVGAPETFISQLKIGDGAQVVFPALNNASYEGVVAEVSYAIDSSTSTYPITVRLSNQGRGLRPGMAAEVTLSLHAQDSTPGFLVPALAVAEDQGGRFVFLLEPTEDGLAKVRRQPVEVGELSGENLVIVAGLEDGQQVVTAGINRMTDGLIVRNIK